MDPFLSSPEELSKQLIVEWLKIVDVTKLDSAYMSHNSRARFLSLIANPQIIFKHIVGTSFNSADDSMVYLGWLAQRGCSIHSVSVPTKIGNYAEFLNAFFYVCGPGLNQMELRQYNNEGYQAYDSIVACVTEHCHHLQQLTLTEGFSIDSKLLHQQLMPIYQQALIQRML